MQADLLDDSDLRRPRTDPGAVVRAGFIPLLDCAILVAAAEKGFAASEGIRLRLVRETSWANIRDRVAIGHFDVAHMLAPMPIASSLGIGHLTVAMIAPLALGLGGNAITVSSRLWRAMAAAGATGDGDPRSTGAALRSIVAERAALGLPPLAFGMVYPFSCHNYELRYWLAASGIHPDRDVRLAVIPPPFMVDALTTGHVDGFCVGEPWNSLAVEAGVGVIVTTKAQIWRLSPEKVLGLRADWAERHPDRLAALIRALWRAAAWCDEPANHAELAYILAQPAYLDCPVAVLRRGLAGRLVLPAETATPIADFLVFSRKAATFPWTSHALWLFAQMVRWGQVAPGAAAAATARATYRPDLYRAALRGLEVPMPTANAKVEGALPAATPVGSTNGRLILGPDGLFDNVRFDPDRLDDYIAGFDLRTESAPS
jgi:NitT/TauT family transport system ATP-binding protein